MLLVNTHEAKTKLSELLFKIENSDELVRICRNGKPIADLVPVISIANPLKQNEKLSHGRMLYNPVEPLSEDEWPSEYR